MKLGLHTMANGTACLKFECENDTEKKLLEFFYGKQSVSGSCDYFVNSWESITLQTTRVFKK